MSAQRRIVAVVNPNAGRGAGCRAFPHIHSFWRQRFGDRAEVVLSEDAGHVRRLAETAAHEGADIFLACGGDGTAHYALPALCHSQTALGIIPIGSGNDLSLNMGIPQTLEAALETVVTGVVRSIDLAQARSGAYACIAGVGLDSEVNRRANARNRWIRGRALYPLSIFQTLVSFRPRQVRIRCDGEVFEGGIMFAVVANASSYGRGIRIAPRAKMDDGFLNVGIVKAISKWELLRVYPRTYRGAHVDHPCFLELQGQTVDIESDTPLDLFGDGEFMEQTPTHIQILPRALRVIVPHNASLTR